jgi:hypothetical protein
MKEYNPFNWYWAVNGDETKVYSSATGNYVPVGNATYIAWAADGTMPTKIDSEINVGGVLAAYYPDITRPIPAAILDGYQETQCNDIFTRKLVKLLFNFHNRIRVLEGQSTHTAVQARAFVKNLM